MRTKLKNFLSDAVSTLVTKVEVLVKCRKVAANRTQFPLTSVWAVTIHKAQGRTIDHLAVSSAGVFWAEQMYTVLSRVKIIEGLYILGESASKVKADSRSKQEMGRLTDKNIFKLDIPSTVTVSSLLYFKLSLIDINSLPAHHAYLAADNCLLDSDIVALTETWLKRIDDSYDFNISSDRIIQLPGECHKME